MFYEHFYEHVQINGKNIGLQARISTLSWDYLIRGWRSEFTYRLCNWNHPYHAGSFGGEVQVMKGPLALSGETQVAPPRGFYGR